MTASGEVELELGLVGFMTEGSDRSLVVPAAVLNWGIVDGWELVLEARHVVRLGSWEALTLHLNGAASWTRAHTPGLFGGLIGVLLAAGATHTA